MAPQGVGKGLAYRHDWGRNIDTLYQRENLKSQVEVEKQRRTQFYGNMLKEGHVIGDYNNQRLEGFYKELNSKLADFAISNPGWETDPGKFAQFINLTDQYLNNDIVREDLQVADQFKALQSEVQSGRMSSQQIMTEMDRYNNYITNGGDPYMFINPKQFEFNDLVRASAANIGYTQLPVAGKTPEGIPGTKIVKKAKEASIQNEVTTNFADPDKKRAILSNYEEAGGKAVAATPQEYYANIIRGTSDYSETEVSMSEYQKIMLQKGANGDPSRSLVHDYVFVPYANAVESGKDIGPTDLQPHQSNSTLTPWGKVGNTLQIHPADGYKIMTQDGIRDFNYSAFTELAGVGSFMTNSFSPYIQSTVEIRIPREKVDSKNTQDTQMLKLLTEGGFERVEYEKNNALDIYGKTSADEIIYRGTLLAPAILNEITYNDFDNDTYGEKTMQSIQASGTYKEMQTLRSIADRANMMYQNSGKAFEVKQNRVVSTDGKYWIDLNGDIRLNE